MNEQQPLTVWDKIDLAVLTESEETVSTDEDSVKKVNDKQRRRRLRRVLDIISAAAWIYVLVKLFVFDIDRVLIGNLAPGLKFLVDYRILVFLVALTIIVIIGKKRSLLWLTYIAIFPLVVICWKLPRVIYRTRNWMALLIVLNVISSFFDRFRISLSVYTAALIAAAIISFSGTDTLIIPAIVVVALTTLVMTLRTIKKSLQSSRFLQVQTSFLTKAAGNKAFDSLASLDPEFRDSSVQKLDRTQLQQFQMKLGMALSAVHGVRFWAYELREYQKSGAASIFGILSYAWLYVRVVLGATFFNYGLFLIDSENFRYDTVPSFLKVLHYSLSALAINNVDGLYPASDMALGTNIFLGFLGPLLLATLTLHIIVTQRQQKHEEEFQRVVRSIDKIEASLAARIEDEFQTSPSEALSRLRQLGESFWVGIIDVMTAKITEMHEQRMAREHRSP